ncbi:unnamed protein product [Effrenium voratum]|nr:unnamed protein product [Effrenium voratum]
MDEQLALLASITSCDVEECRAALARCGGDVEAAAQRLVAAAEALTAGRCGECGQDAAGYYGQGSYGSSFFCKACWRRWDEASGPAVELLRPAPEEGMLQRDLGLLEAETLEELGRLLMQRACAKWRLPLRRTGATFAASAAAKRVWQGLAEGAEAALRRRRFQLPAAWAFLAGAEAEVGEEVWQLLTIYEAQAGRWAGAGG